jgi:L-fucose isomerase-like protein
MLKTKAGFVVYGTHKDGLNDPMGVPFIDSRIIESQKEVLRSRNIELVEWETVLATKAEAKEALASVKKDDSIDALILCSGTWIWAGHMIAAVRDFAMSGKPIILWTHPGSQGWRPVGGFVMHGALLEAGIPHKFVYAAADETAEVDEIAHHCRAGRIKNSLNQSTIGVFGGRGMGQTCGVADPSQWMRVFGIDIDSRDTTELLETAKAVTDDEISAVLPRIEKLFGARPPEGDLSRRSIALYLGLKKVIARNGFDFYTIQSFPGLGDDYGATCFAQSLMLDDGVPTSTLSDFNTALSVYVLMKLSGGPVYYGDLQHVDKAAGEIKIIGDGAVPPSLADPRDPAGFAGHGIPTEGSAGGLSVKLTCKPGPCALARLGRVDGEFVMVLAKGEVFVPEDLEKRKAECGIPFWPHAFVKVEGDIDRLLQNYNNEYGVLGYGKELYGGVKAFCEIMGIRLVEI